MLQELPPKVGNIRRLQLHALDPGHRASSPSQGGPDPLRLAAVCLAAVFGISTATAIRYANAARSPSRTGRRSTTALTTHVTTNRGASQSV
ncbi:hypothetical protein [Streptomyces regalis]|uniref:hypothetical protein n=1 Tax=Streptomyces regalis TaxID=68262 RepID=UPI00131D6A1B|nr:hypothetical protein [Streptomyces regalis]